MLCSHARQAKRPTCAERLLNLFRQSQEILIAVHMEAVIWVTGNLRKFIVVHILAHPNGDQCDITLLGLDCEIVYFLNIRNSVIHDQDGNTENGRNVCNNWQLFTGLSMIQNVIYYSTYII